MKVIDLYEVANRLAPKSLSDEYCVKYGAYDNSGVLVDTGDDVKRVLFSLDLSKKAIEKAKEFGANVIVTHHPAIYGKIGDLKADNALGGKLVDCIKNGISVISMHLNLDCAEDGIDESLAKSVMVASKSEESKMAVNHLLTVGGYGRAYTICPMTAKELAAKLGVELSSEKVLVYNGEKEVTRVASFCGAGGDEEGVAFALRTGADVVISSDFRHHVIAMAVEAGLSVIVLTHYASENYGFKKYYEKFIEQTYVPCKFYTDETLL